MTVVAKNTDCLTRNASVEIEIEMNLLGISKDHLVRPIDDRYVAELVETDENEWEPIEVRLWPEGWDKPSPDVVYHVVSGNHRTCAALIKRLKTVRARIIEAYDDLSYLHAAIRTNARHGRNFTEDDRKALASKLKTLGESSSDIAKLFGVHKSTVNTWLSGRDTNASKKRQPEVKTYSASIDAEWDAIPDVPVSDRDVMQVRMAIANFLADTPTGVDKSHVLAWCRSLAPFMRQAQADDIRETVRWLQNVVALLEAL